MSEIQWYVLDHLQSNHIIFSGYLFWHIFCSCLLQNASDFWMKCFPTGCNFCSFSWVHQFCWINFRWWVYAVYVEGFFDSSSPPAFFNFKESFVAPIKFVLDLLIWSPIPFFFFWVFMSYSFWYFLVQNLFPVSPM